MASLTTSCPICHAPLARGQSSCDICGAELRWQGIAPPFWYIPLVVLLTLGAGLALGFGIFKSLTNTRLSAWLPRFDSRPSVSTSNATPTPLIAFNANDPNLLTATIPAPTTSEQLNVEATQTSLTLTQTPFFMAEALSTSTATPTLVPSPTATATSTLTVSPSATPTPTRRPSPTPCAVQVAGQFRSLHEQAGGVMSGCPTGNTFTRVGAWEPFQKGEMIWVGEPDGTQGMIYVLYQNGQWQEYYDGFTEGDPEEAGYTPPSGLLEPRRGFGKIWRDELGASSATLGWATQPETGVRITAQSFNGTGIMIEFNGRKYYLPDGKQWLSE